MSDLICPTGQKLVAGGPYKSEIAPFCIDEHEVTQGEYAADKFVKMPEIDPKLKGPRKPMVNVGWDDAKAYCIRRGGDLPTHNEWAKAMRGPHEKKYGTKSGELNKDEARFDATGPMDVMSYPPNDYGLYDMTGNVWEWVLDTPPWSPSWFGLFSEMRGGSWSVHTKEMTGSGCFEGGSVPVDESIGFRCTSFPKKWR